MERILELIKHVYARQLKPEQMILALIFDRAGAISWIRRFEDWCLTGVPDDPEQERQASYLNRARWQLGVYADIIGDTLAFRRASMKNAEKA